MRFTSREKKRIREYSGSLIPDSLLLNCACLLWRAKLSTQTKISQYVYHNKVDYVWPPLLTTVHLYLHYQGSTRFLATRSETKTLA